MKLNWKYKLENIFEPEAYMFEGPICVYNGNVYFITCSFEEMKPEHKGDNNRRNQLLQLHKINIESGIGITTETTAKRPLMTSEWSFIETNGSLFIHLGDFYDVLNGMNQLKILPYGKVVGNRSVSRGEFLINEDTFIFSNAQNSTLYSYDIKQKSILWKQSISNTKPYTVGQPQLFNGLISVYGADCINLFEPLSGRIQENIKIPRIDKLFNPIFDDENIILGYTNWSNAGVLKFNTKTKKVVWRHKRTFEGPNLYWKIYKYGESIFWVKNEREIICIDSQSGEELWNVNTLPWLYTELSFRDGNIIYGTAGRDGYINCVNANNGKVVWSNFLKNGCSYFDYYRNSVIVGDYDKFIRRIDISSGKVIDKLQLDGEVVGDIRVADNKVYSIVWNSENKPARLISLDID